MKWQFPRVVLPALLCISNAKQHLSQQTRICSKEINHCFRVLNVKAAIRVEAIAVAYALPRFHQIHNQSNSNRKNEKRKDVVTVKSCLFIMEIDITTDVEFWIFPYSQYNRLMYSICQHASIKSIITTYLRIRK